MTAITVFSGLFCDAGSVVRHVVDITGYRLVEDMEIIADAADLSGLDADYLAGLFSSDERILESNQADREQIVTWLRYAMVKKLSEEQNLVFWGYTALLLPPDTKNVLSVCLVNERDNRLCAACRGGKCSEGNAQDLIASDDLVRSDWVLAVTDCNDPWCDTLYDLVIPVGSVGIKQSAYLIIGQLANATVQDSEASREYLNDLMLAAEVQAELTRKGYDICVASKKGALTLSFKNHELMLKNATRKLFDSVVELDGVAGVEIGVGARYNPNDIFQMMPGRMLRQAVAPAKCNGLCESDQKLAAMIGEFLSHEDKDISVCVKNGFVSLTINDHQKMLQHAAHPLSEWAQGFAGVKSVEVGVGKEYQQFNAYMKVRRKQSRAFLSDEKRKFAPNVSRRLRRNADMSSFALYDGKSAFYAMDGNDPKVIVLDMQNSEDGDLLRKVKALHPNTEVLVLAGHEADKYRDTYLDLGAFAYLNKPVNTADLSETIRAASEKSRSYAH